MRHLTVSSQMNSHALNKAIADGKLDVRLNTNLMSIEDDTVTMASGTDGEKIICAE